MPHVDLIGFTLELDVFRQVEFGDVRHVPVSVRTTTKAGFGAGRQTGGLRRANRASSACWANAWANSAMSSGSASPLLKSGTGTSAGRPAGGML